MKPIVTKNSAINEVLVLVHPQLEAKVELYKQAALKKENPCWTNFHEEMTALGLVFDMVKALGKHIKPTDTLSNTSFRTTAGVFKIETNVHRDGERYFLETRMIDAGGYNIQRYHYRYLTNTTLPSSTGDQDSIKAIDTQIKNMTKAEKLGTEIKIWEKRIENITLDIETRNLMTREEKLAHGPYAFKYPTYENLNSPSVMYDRYHGNPEGYAQYVKGEEDRKIELFDRSTKIKVNDIKMYEKELNKLKTKLEAIEK